MKPPPDPLGPATDLVEWLLSLARDERERAVDALGPADREALDRDWASWAHDGQLWPEPGWRTWVVKGGRGFGKTLAGANWVTAEVAKGEPIRIALVAATMAEARRVMVEGPSGMLEVAGAWVTEWSPSLRRLKFRTGAEATLFSGHSPEILRGPEHHIAWCDELAKWEEAEASWDMLQLGLRLGERPRAIVTTTPRPGPVLSSIMADPETVVTGGPSSANPHTSPAWRRGVYARYAGTRLGRQELEGEVLPDVPGALWTEALLERCRARPPLPLAGGEEPRSGEGEGLSEPLYATFPPPTPPASGRGAFTRIVIAVDPPTGDGTCGIVACAKDGDGRAHILADHSVTARTPEGWARAVADAALVWGQYCNTVPVAVAESNQGGEMVKAVLRTADPHLRVTLVQARHGKSERASPVAILFEAGKVVLHGRFPELEAQLCGMIAGGDYEGPGRSPDRADAMVWGLTELMLEEERPMPRVRRL